MSRTVAFRLSRSLIDWSMTHFWACFTGFIPKTRLKFATTRHDQR
jgi:hypothetical protein